MKHLVSAVLVLASLSFCRLSYGQYSEAQLERWLKRFPEADANRDGELSIAEAADYVKELQSSRGKGGGAPRTFEVDPGWKAECFPEHAVCYKSPDEIAKLYAKQTGDDRAVVRFAKPTDGSLRIVGTGHSFMAPGYKTFPAIVEAAGLKQPPLLTHTGGGITGSTRYKWEQENGIFEFDGKPTPKLLASISNGEWDAMMWGPYFNDHPQYYSCWIDFCLKYNPDMKFYLSDAWPQLYQLNKVPESEEELTPEVIAKLGDEKFEIYSEILNELNEKYDNRIFIMPTCEAMVQCVKYFDEGKLPGIDGIHKAVGNKERSLWRDQLGHLGPGLDRLEGYVFYATIYGRNPQNIPGDIFEDSKFPSQTLDRRFREIAWQAVLRNPLSGVVDKNENGIADDRE
ncbi:hypothetical protein AB1L42_01160 [Thalassoglobus sp. JC818]|uniref:hypothetical protein n=1 Tax=Thalassoglobus sp. JC818 TaxID=3232136 RepID=UPI003459FCBE